MFGNGSSYGFMREFTLKYASSISVNFFPVDTSIWQQNTIKDIPTFHENSRRLAALIDFLKILDLFYPSIAKGAFTHVERARLRWLIKTWWFAHCTRLKTPTWTHLPVSDSPSESLNTSEKGDSMGASVGSPRLLSVECRGRFRWFLDVWLIRGLINLSGPLSTGRNLQPRRC